MFIEMKFSGVKLKIKDRVLASTPYSLGHRMRNTLSIKSSEHSYKRSTMLLIYKTEIFETLFFIQTLQLQTSRKT
jgi:hypothetical protein